jgi:hypothetical protein
MKFSDAFNAPRNFTSEKWEHYFEIYDHLLGHLYGSKVNFLEIGVQNGGSLEIAQNLFSKESKIIGLDIDPRCKILETVVADHILIGSQIDDHVLQKIFELTPHLNIIIDDGSHIQSHMILTFLKLFSHLSQGGIYIIEDTHTNYSHEHQESFLGIGLYDYFKGLSERLNIDFINPQHRKERFKLPRDLRPEVKTYPDIINEIFSIEFFNSIIAIRKKMKVEPLRIRK